MNAPPTMTPPLLQVDNLTIAFGSMAAVKGVSFHIRPGEILGIVGESGSGKSITCRALMGLLPRTAQAGGSVRLEGRGLLDLSEPDWCAIRGRDMGMIFQNPASHLDPLRRIGKQIAAPLVRHLGISRREALRRAVKLLDDVGIRDPEVRARSYPHEFSGGMRQRVVLAMALIGEPRLLIADEPTTALDVRVQDQVLDLLDDVSTRRGLAVLFITHDLGVVAGFAERVMVMYSGRIVEDGEVSSVFAEPSHPYTQGLIKAVPRIDQDLHQLYAIPGAPPPPLARPSGCPFHPRCDKRFDRCDKQRPALLPLSMTRVACHLHDGKGA